MIRNLATSSPAGAERLRFMVESGRDNAATSRCCRQHRRVLSSRWARLSGQWRTILLSQHGCRGHKRKALQVGWSRWQGWPTSSRSGWH